MIHPDNLYRLIRNIIGETDTPGAVHVSIANLSERHELDIQDTATLYRVASGEAVERTTPAGSQGGGHGGGGISGGGGGHGGIGWR